jgi:hypothetical protein
MQAFEYKVIPAPRRGEKARGARTTPERFAVALTHVMNDLARDGWEYLRADTLPCDERVGLTGTATHFQNMLVFRRRLAPQPAAAARPAPPRPAEAPPGPAASTQAAADLIPDAAADAAADATVIAALTPRPPEGSAPALGPARGPALGPALGPPPGSAPGPVLPPPPSPRPNGRV